MSGLLIEKVCHTLPVTKETRSLLLNTKVDINGGRFQNMCEALTYLLDNIFIRFGTKLYRQVVGIPMVTNCAPLIADLFFFALKEIFFLIIKKLKLFKQE